MTSPKLNLTNDVHHSVVLVYQILIYVTILILYNIPIYVTSQCPKVSKFIC